MTGCRLDAAGGKKLRWYSTSKKNFLLKKRKKNVQKRAKIMQKTIKTHKFNRIFGLLNENTAIFITKKNFKQPKHKKTLKKFAICENFLRWYRFWGFANKMGLPSFLVDF